ncbi:MAG: bifunctional UDP-sugar hydrolase/5'-nucleotidase [Burkholderiales bacterium]|nr:bifunctional UDP-sugar hydrolase/5'-nucleotidase [Burkholderiales bacterium]
MRILQTAPAVGLLLILSACTSLAPSGPAPERSYAITILHTNDHHGRFWQNGDGEYGMAARKTVVDAIRAEVAAAGGYSLLLDGGDVNTGVPESDLQDAVPDFKGMNLLGYDAMAVGNHEFDKSPAVLAMQRKLATFPMLSANIYRNGEHAFAPYTLFNLGGVRVAVMGLTTEDTRMLGNPDNMQDLEFRSPIQEAAKLVPELRSQADVVIAATHMGHYADGRHGIQAPGDVEMARAVKGLDLVVGGHTQNPACMQAENVLDTNYVPGMACQPDRQNGTWIVQAHEWGKYVGRADFLYRNGSFTLVKYALIPINLMRPAAEGTTRQTYAAPIAENPEMLALLKPYQDFGRQKLLVAVGSSDARLEGDRSVVRKQATNLGMLIGQAMMDKTHADFAVVNSGGLRESLPDGPITYKDVLKVQPFGNTLITVELTGREVLDYLQVAARMSPGAGGFPHYSGIEPILAGDTVVQARIAGAFVNPMLTYRMVINNFMAVGGDGYPKMTSHPSYVNTGFVDAEVLRAYIAVHSPLQAARFAPPKPLTCVEKHCE